MKFSQSRISFLHTRIERRRCILYSLIRKVKRHVAQCGEWNKHGYEKISENMGCI
jgi:hypothetical protein